VTDRWQRQGKSNVSIQASAPRVLDPESPGSVPGKRVSNSDLTDIYISSYRYRVMPKQNPDAFLPLRSNWFHILLCLVEGEQHGWGIMQNVLARSDGKVRLWPATLYGSLRRLIEAGLIVESGDRPAPEFDDARRRYYKLTTLGRRVLDLESQRLKDLVRVLDARRRREART
jgi:DNA-binding PadR family transcriptional regulator